MTHRSGERIPWAVTGVLVATVVGALVVSAPAKTKLSETLTATVHAPGASGAAKLLMKSGTNGKLTIKARRLPGRKSFDVIVNKVKVGTLVTGAGGSGVARFSTSPKGHAAALGFDPPGAQIEVRDEETGDDDLQGGMP